MALPYLPAAALSALLVSFRAFCQSASDFLPEATGVDRDVQVVLDVLALDGDSGGEGAGDGLDVLLVVGVVEDLHRAVDLVGHALMGCTAPVLLKMSAAVSEYRKAMNFLASSMCLAFFGIQVASMVVLM